LKCLVTGAAGFIGSHLSDALVEQGHRVVGIDNFSDYYPRQLKERNLSNLSKEKDFHFIVVDLAQDDLTKVMHGIDYIFHLAAQPGVRRSWGSSFSIYLRDNVFATQRLLEATKGTRVKRFIYASSSSIYGNSERLPTRESTIPAPVSPYGVTKLAAEHLCHSYLKNYGVRTVVLRYFTVFGPRQRPDMAINILISRIASGRQIDVFGDGNQRRDFTFVSDVVSATIAAMRAPSGSIYNVGAGSTTSLNEVIRMTESALHKRARIRYKPQAKGDVRNTSADISKISDELGYRPATSLRDGIARQVEEQRRLHSYR
jgi:nucleoside-diphosphate-sugar epimerase